MASIINGERGTVTLLTHRVKRIAFAYNSEQPSLSMKQVPTVADMHMHMHAADIS